MKAIMIVFAAALLISFQSVAQKNENVINDQGISVPASEMNVPNINGVYPSPDGNNIAEHKRHYETTRMSQNVPNHMWVNPEFLKPEKEGIRESSIKL